MRWSTNYFSEKRLVLSAVPGKTKIRRTKRTGENNSESSIWFLFGLAATLAASRLNNAF
jgi:hypothetical protein